MALKKHLLLCSAVTVFALAVPHAVRAEDGKLTKEEKKMERAAAFCDAIPQSMLTQEDNTSHGDRLAPTSEELAYEKAVEQQREDDRVHIRNDRRGIKNADIVVTLPPDITVNDVAVACRKKEKSNNGKALAKGHDKD